MPPSNKSSLSNSKKNHKHPGRLIKGFTFRLPRVEMFWLLFLYEYKHIGINISAIVSLLKHELPCLLQNLLPNN